MISLSVALAGNKAGSTKLAAFSLSMVPNMICGVNKATAILEREIKRQLSKPGRGLLLDQWKCGGYKMEVIGLKKVATLKSTQSELVTEISLIKGDFDGWRVVNDCYYQMGREKMQTSGDAVVQYFATEDEATTEFYRLIGHMVCHMPVIFKEIKES